MVNFCVINGCKQESYPGCGKTFHKIPADNERRNLWITAMKLDSNVSKSACICSLHFKDEDYSTAAKSKLKLDAVPSVLPKNEKPILIYKKGKIICTRQSMNVKDVASRILQANRNVESENVGSSGLCENVEITSEPPSKKLKPDETSTQSQEITKMKRKVKLRRYIKYLKQKVKVRDAEIENLKKIIKKLTKKNNQ